eukprot:2478994-Pleurochrysis_carterae.AAC.1
MRNSRQNCHQAAAASLAYWRLDSQGTDRIRTRIAKVSLQCVDRGHERRKRAKLVVAAVDVLRDRKAVEDDAHKVVRRSVPCRLER